MLALIVWNVSNFFDYFRPFSNTLEADKSSWNCNTHTWNWEFWQWLKSAKLQTELAIKALRKRLKMHHLNALFSGNEDKEGWHFYRKLAEDQPACSHVFYLAIALLLWSGVKEVQWSTCQREMRLRPAFFALFIYKLGLIWCLRLHDSMGIWGITN